MLRLLLVEDDDIDREMTRRALEACGLDVDITEAGTFKEAVHLLGSVAFDCILSDLTLPDGHGLDLIPLGPSAAFVALTGLDHRNARGMLNQGAQDYLLKDRLEPYWLGRSLEYAIERKRLQLYQRRAEHHDRLASLGQLAASVAHEINNPTAFVAANVESLRHWLQQALRRYPELAEDPTCAEVQTALKDSQQGLDRIGAIVRQLRSFARRPDEVEPVGEVTLSEVTLWAVALTRVQITHHAAFEQRLEECDARFPGRPGRLAQVLTNLLLNASHAVADASEPRVRLTTLQKDDVVVAIVEDSGRGIAPELRERVVEPFFTTKPAGQGTGLGLALAKEIVEEHSGRLELGDSDLGGLRVTVTLPLATGLPLSERRAAPTSGGRQQPLTVLVVDDEPALRRAYTRLLRPHAVLAMDGVGALQWLREGTNASTVDAVICDVMMPDIDGQDVYEAAQALDPNLASRFIFCSGGAFREDMASFLQTVTNPVLLKPTNRDALMDAVGRVSLEAHDSAERAAASA